MWHQPHVRHNPPWTSRHWVTTPEGRREHLGRELSKLFGPQARRAVLFPASEIRAHSVPSLQLRVKAASDCVPGSLNTARNVKSLLPRPCFTLQTRSPETPKLLSRHRASKKSHEICLSQNFNQFFPDWAQPYSAILASIARAGKSSSLTAQRSFVPSARLKSCRDEGKDKVKIPTEWDAPFARQGPKLRAGFFSGRHR